MINNNSVIDFRSSDTWAKRSVFPGGELYLKLEEQTSHVENLVVYTYLENSDDIMNLILVRNALDQQNRKTNLILCAPYIPYGRQDRTVRSGEPFSLKAMADILNKLVRPSTLYTHDIHSEATRSLMDFNVVDLGGANAFKAYRMQKPDFAIIPDAGATKRTKEYLKDFIDVKYIQCIKNRDFNNSQGVVDELIIVDKNPEKLEGKKLFILDDICSGGATFINLAKELSKYKPAEITLYVTHGIFNKGLECLFESGITKIITTDSRREVKKFITGDDFVVLNCYS